MFLIYTAKREKAECWPSGGQMDKRHCSHHLRAMPPMSFVHQLASSEIYVSWMKLAMPSSGLRRAVDDDDETREKEKKTSQNPHPTATLPVFLIR